MQRVRFEEETCNLQAAEAREAGGLKVVRDES